MEKKKSKKIAGLLAILLGEFGVHWFYLKKTKKAVIFLIIGVLSLLTIEFTFAIPYLIIGIVALIEGITFFTMSNDKFDEKYNNEISGQDMNTFQPNVLPIGATRHNFCPNCGQKIENDAKFCPSCGACTRV